MFCVGWFLWTVCPVDKTKDALSIVRTASHFTMMMGQIFSGSIFR